MHHVFVHRTLRLSVLVDQHRVDVAEVLCLHGPGDYETTGRMLGQNWYEVLSLWEWLDEGTFLSTFNKHILYRHLRIGENGDLQHGHAPISKNDFAHSKVCASSTCEARQ
jgi:hypothetical protein